MPIFAWQKSYIFYHNAEQEVCLKVADINRWHQLVLNCHVGLHFRQCIKHVKEMKNVVKSSLTCRNMYFCPTKETTIFQRKASITFSFTCKCIKTSWDKILFTLDISKMCLNHKENVLYCLEIQYLWICICNINCTYELWRRN